MKTKTIKIYNYDELSKESKERVLNYFRINESYDFLSEDLKEVLFQELEKNNIKVTSNLNLYYSLNNCQGDGVCFVGLFKFEEWKVKIEHNGHYYNSHSTNIYIYKINEDGDEVEGDKIIYESFKQIYRNICDYIEKVGYEQIDYNNSEENIKENIEANNYMFRENGILEK